MSNEHRSPAGRLLYLRSRSGLKECDKTGREGFWALFEIESGDHQRFAMRFGSLLSLPHEVAHQFSLIPKLNHSKYLQWVEPLVNHWNTCGISSGPKHFFSAVNSERAASIDICHDLLISNDMSDGASAKEIADLRADVEEFRKLIVTANIDAELRRIIVNQLQLIDQCLCDALFVGKRAIRAAVAECALQCAEHREVLEHFKDGPEVAQLWNTLDRLATLATLAQFGSQLLQAGAKLFLTGSR